MPESPEPDKEVESILSDLDAILSGIGPVAASEAPATPAATPSAPPTPAPSPAPAPAPAIELAPRSGIAPPRTPEPAKEKEPEKPKAGLPAAHPPLEIKLGGSAESAAPKPAPAAAAPPAPARPGAAPPPPAPKTEPAAAPKPAPAPAAAAPAPAPAGDGSVPADAPKEQIRRVAFFFVAAQEPKLREFMGFLDTVALKVSKKPMYVRRVLVQPVQGKEDPKRLVEQARAAGAAGVVAMLATLPDSWVRELEEVAGDEDYFFRVVAPEEAQKRSTAVDLLVDLMLLAP